MPERPQTTLEEAFSGLVYQAIQDASNGTDRSKQQQDYRLGPSNIGHCRQYAKYLVEQTAPTDPRDVTAAFYGTVLGDAIEKQLAKDYPNWLYQAELVFHIPSGGEMDAHPDVVIPDEYATEQYPQGILDLKSRAELESIKRYGRSQQQEFQLHQYASAAIDAGLLDPSKPIYLTNVWFDRSAKDEKQQPYSITTEYDPAMLMAIDEWINDVKYAVMHQEDASRDKPREFCWNWCEYATLCRGTDTDVEGLLTDEAVLAAVEMKREASALESRAKQLKNAAQIALKGVNGSTGTHTVRWVEVGEADVAYRRAAYMKLDVRPVGRKKPVQ